MAGRERKLAMGKKQKSASPLPPKEATSDPVSDVVAAISQMQTNTKSPSKVVKKVVTRKLRNSANKKAANKGLRVNLKTKTKAVGIKKKVTAIKQAALKNGLQKAKSFLGSTGATVLSDKPKRRKIIKKEIKIEPIDYEDGLDVHLNSVIKTEIKEEPEDYDEQLGMTSQIFEDLNKTANSDSDFVDPEELDSLKCPDLANSSDIVKSLIKNPDLVKNSNLGKSPGLVKSSSCSKNSDLVESSDVATSELVKSSDTVSNSDSVIRSDSVTNSDSVNNPESDCNADTVGHSESFSKESVSNMDSLSYPHLSNTDTSNTKINSSASNVESSKLGSKKVPNVKPNVTKTSSRIKANLSKDNSASKTVSPAKTANLLKSSGKLTNSAKLSSPKTCTAAKTNISRTSNTQKLDGESECNIENGLELDSAHIEMDSENLPKTENVDKASKVSTLSLDTDSTNEVNSKNQEDLKDQVILKEQPVKEQIGLNNRDTAENFESEHLNIETDRDATNLDNQPKSEVNVQSRKRKLRNVKATLLQTGIKKKNSTDLNQTNKMELENQMNLESSQADLENNPSQSLNQIDSNQGLESRTDLDDDLENLATNRVDNLLDLNLKKKTVVARRHSIEKSTICEESAQKSPLFNSVPRAFSPRARRNAKVRQSVDAISTRKSSPYSTRSDTPSRLLRNGKQRRLRNSLLEGLSVKKRKRNCSELSEVSKNSGYDSDSSFSDMVPAQGVEDAEVGIKLDDANTGKLKETESKLEQHCILEQNPKLEQNSKLEQNCNLEEQSKVEVLELNQESMLNEDFKLEQNSKLDSLSSLDLKSDNRSNTDTIESAEEELEDLLKTGVNGIHKDEGIDTNSNFYSCESGVKPVKSESGYVDGASISPSIKVPEKSIILDSMKLLFNENTDDKESCGIKEEYVKKEVKEEIGKDLKRTNKELKGMNNELKTLSKDLKGLNKDLKGSNIDLKNNKESKGSNKELTNLSESKESIDEMKESNKDLKETRNEIKGSCEELKSVDTIDLKDSTKELKDVTNELDDSNEINMEIEETNEQSQEGHSDTNSNGNISSVTPNMFYGSKTKDSNLDTPNQTSQITENKDKRDRATRITKPSQIRTRSKDLKRSDIKSELSILRMEVPKSIQSESLLNSSKECKWNSSVEVDSNLPSQSKTKSEARLKSSEGKSKSTEGKLKAEEKLPERKLKSSEGKLKSVEGKSKLSELKLKSELNLKSSELDLRSSEFSLRSSELNSKFSSEGKSDSNESTEVRSNDLALENENEEEFAMKEGILKALGLQSLKAAEAAKLKLKEKESKVENYTGTLKTVIKLNRNDKKKKSILKTSVQKIKKGAKEVEETVRPDDDANKGNKEVRN